VAKAPKTTGAETVRWDLSDLYSSPTDPAIEEILTGALERAIAFETKYRGLVASLEPGDFAAMMRELEERKRNGGDQD